MSTLSAETLADLVRPDEDRAIDALHRGDLRAVRELLPVLARGQAGLDALTLHALARKVGKLRQDLGEDAARRRLLTIGAQLMQTWVTQVQAGDLKGAIADLVAVYKHQGPGRLAPLDETDDAVTVQLTPCGSGGQLQRQKLPQRHPSWYGDWQDGVNSLCQGCKANQQALNDALGYPFWTTQIQADGGCVMRFDKRGGVDGGAGSGQVADPLFDATERRDVVMTRVQRVDAMLVARQPASQPPSTSVASTSAPSTPVAPIDTAAIEALLRGQRKDWMPWHDFAVIWLEYFYATALDIGGPDYLDQVLAQTYAPAFNAGFAHYASLTDEQLVAENARTWNYHMADFTVTEQEDRFVFRLDPCGSGGRLLRGRMWRDMFHYGQPLAPLMPDAHPVNFMRRQAPTYCTHCAASNRAQLAHAGDSSTPLFFVIDGHAQMQAGQPCRQNSFKKNAPASAVDPALFEQIGLSPAQGDKA